MKNSRQILSGFRLNIIIRVLVLLCLCMTLGVVFASTNWFFTPLVIILLIVIATIKIVHYQESTNRDIVTFLTSLKQSNFTNHYFPKRKGKSFDHLENLFHDINDSFLKVNLEKESHYQYLQALNENIGVAIISYLDNGEIQLVNNTAKSLFKKPLLNSIDQLEKLLPDVYRKIKQLQSDGGTAVVNTSINGDLYNLSITCRQFIAQEVPFHVVLIQDIKKALDDKESQSWQKLVRVLTHEIMNSVTPIASLSEAVNQSMRTTNIQTLDKEDLNDIQISIETIENRSKGMVKFVNAYKDYARDLELNKQKVDVSKLISNISNLLSSLLEERHIQLSSSLSTKPLIINVDSGLIEQVLINLVKNAVEAFTGQPNPHIRILVIKEKQNCIIRIEDNGPGISAENSENIFVPFFTTKRKGSGVGLSLSKKIMQLHGGDIQMKSSTAGTEFSLTIPLDNIGISTA